MCKVLGCHCLGIPRLLARLLTLALRLFAALPRLLTPAGAALRLFTPTCAALRLLTWTGDVVWLFTWAVRLLALAGSVLRLLACTGVEWGVLVPAMLSSLLQLPMIAAAIGPHRTIGVLTAFVDRLGSNVLALSGLSPETKIAVTSIENTEEFRGLATQDLDKERFEARLVEAAQSLFDQHDDIGALLLECALYPPYAPALQRRFNVPVFDFVSLIDHLHSVTHRRPPHT